MIRDDFWQRMRFIQRIHRLLYTVGLGPVIGRLILLLTTTGRKSGEKRITPLQYELIDGNYHLGAARGTRADWYRNILKDPEVEVRVGRRHFLGTAEGITNPTRIADFLEVRLERHPRLIGMIMQKAHGLPPRPDRAALEELASKEAMVIITPVKDLR